MDNLDLNPRARRLFIRLLRRHLADRRQRIVNMSGQVQANQAPAFVLKGLSKWSKVGLDLTDSGFSKLHGKESTYEKEKKKFNLSSENFKEYKENLIEKVKRIHAVEECMVRINQNKSGHVLKEYCNHECDDGSQKIGNLAEPTASHGFGPRHC